jgi:histidine decarboxylase
MNNFNLSLDSLLDHLDNCSKYHLGYPLNQKINYQHLAPLLNFIVNNLGDPYVRGNYGLNTKDFEREVVDFIAQLYRLDKSDTWGYVTSGGTEGNLCGILLGRELYPEGILYCSEDSHYSIFKAARMFRMPLKKVKSLANGEIDYDSLSQLLSENKNQPAIININIGTTVKGAVDDISTIVQIISELKLEKFYLHVDAALGGMLLPYLESEKSLDFSKYPIGSIAISGHKFIGSPIPCGVVVASKHLIQSFDIEYLNSSDTTILGSRNGMAPVILWDAIQKRQDEFALEAMQCRQNAEYLYQRIKNSHRFALLNPLSTTVVFEAPHELIVQRWQLSCCENMAHVIVMQNHTRKLLDQFLEEAGFVKDSVTYSLRANAMNAS